MCAQDRIESCEALCKELRAQIAQLAVENAGLRATNQVLEASEQQRLQRALTAASQVVGACLPVLTFVAHNGAAR